MRPSIGGGTLLVLAALVANPCASVTTTVLFKSGDPAADGVRIGSFADPIATGPSTVVFRGTTSAILVTDGTALDAVAQTGGPLSPPLTGTFNDFGDPVINDRGAIAFRAGLNSLEATAGVFLFEAGSFVPVVLANLEAADINARSDVLLRSRRGDLDLWNRSTQTVASIVSARSSSPRGGRFRRLGSRPVLSDGGTVAFQGEVRFSARERRTRHRSKLTGIYTAGLTGTLVVAEAGDASPTGGGAYAGFARDAALSINASGEIAFVAEIVLATSTTDAVLLYQPSLPGTTVIAQIGDPVGTGRLTHIFSTYVGVNSRGDVAFEGCIDGTRCTPIVASGGHLMARPGVVAPEFAPRLTDTGHFAWSDATLVQRCDGVVTTVLDSSSVTPIGANVQAGRPSINGLDAVAFRVFHDAIYLLRDGAAYPIVKAGDPVPAVGAIGRFGPHRFRGDVLAFRGQTNDGTDFIATARDGALVKVVSSGEPTPLGGVFDLAAGAFDLHGSRIVFTAQVTGGAAAEGVFRTRAADPPEVLATAGDRAPGGGRFASFVSVLASERTILLETTLDGARHALFLRRGRRPLVRVATTDDRGQRNGHQLLARISNVALDGPRVLISADDGEERSRLFLWRAGARTRIATEGELTPGGGHFGEEFGAIAVDGRRAAFVAPIADGAATAGLFMHRGHTTVTLVLFSAPSPIGDAVALPEVTDADAITLTDDAVVLRANLAAGAGAKLSLLSIAP